MFPITQNISHDRKEISIDGLRIRTRKLAIDIIELCRSLKRDPATNVISYQLIKSTTSTGANYRAACRVRSKAEFFSKMSIVLKNQMKPIIG